jgi:hypothetical protein
MRNRRSTIGIVFLAGVVIAASFVFAGAQAGNLNGVCLSNAKQLSTGMIMYTQDYDMIMPPTRSQPKFQNVVMPYIKNKSIFLCPASKTPFVINPAISGKNMKTVKSPASTWMLHDPKAHADGMWSIAFVDGHAKRAKTATGGTK